MLFFIFVAGTLALFWIGPSFLRETLLFDFCCSLTQFTGRVVYIVLAFCMQVVLQIIRVFTHCFPYIWRILTFIISFTIWTVRQIYKGVFGTGNLFMTIVSWVFCLCVCILYFETYFKRVTTSEVEQNNRNLLREMDQLAEFENLENENEENNQEEAEINMAAEDNDRNQVRETEHNPPSLRPVSERTACRFRGEKLVVRLPKQSGGKLFRENIKTNSKILNLQHKFLESSSDESETDGCSLGFSSDDEQLSSDFSSKNLTSDTQNGTDMAVRDSINRSTSISDSADNNLCIVCFEENRNVAVFPCGHLYLCSSCVQSIMKRSKTCPVCQNQIQECRRVYL